MAEDSQEDKTEEGSEKKLREALEGGNTPFSREASVFLSLGAMLVVCSYTLTGGVRSLAAALASMFASPTRDPLATLADASAVLRLAGWAAAMFLLPILLLLMLAGLVAGLAQGMPRLVLERIRPKPSKLSPAAGLKRLLARDGAIEFAKNLAKFAIVSGLIALLMRGQGEALLDRLYVEPAALGPFMLNIVARLLAGSLVAYAALAGADLVWARLRWRRDLRMTRQEMKDEMKQAEGDPFVKAKRRSLAMERSRRRMMAAVPRATMVVANPTHYAIALRYSREEGGAPIVLAKGQDLVALKIRAIAEANDIPVFEDKALARSMYDHVEVSQLIPAEFYKAVAQLIHFIQARNARAARTPVKV